MGNSKQFLQDIVGKEGYEKLSTVLTKSFASEAAAASMAVPRALLSWANQHIAPLKVGEYKTLDFPGQSHLKIHIQKQSDNMYKGAFLKDGKAIHVFADQFLPSFDSTEKSEPDQKALTIIKALIKSGMPDAKQGDYEQLEKAATVAPQVMKDIGNLIDAMVAKNMVSQSIDDLNKAQEQTSLLNINKDRGAPEVKQQPEGKAAQDQKPQAQNPLKKEDRKEGSGGYPEQDIPQSQLEAANQQQLGYMKINMDRGKPKLKDRKEGEEAQDQKPASDNPLAKDAMNPAGGNRGLRHLLMKPLHAAINGFAAAGAAEAAHKMPTPHMEQLSHTLKHPPQPAQPAIPGVSPAIPAKPSPPMKKAMVPTGPGSMKEMKAPPKNAFTMAVGKAEKLAKPYVSEAQRGFFHTASARAAGITPADTKHWDDASKGQKNLPKHVKKAEMPGGAAKPQVSTKPQGPAAPVPASNNPAGAAAKQAQASAGGKLAMPKIGGGAAMKNPSVKPAMPKMPGATKMPGMGKEEAPPAPAPTSTEKPTGKDRTNSQLDIIEQHHKPMSKQSYFRDKLSRVKKEEYPVGQGGGEASGALSNKEKPMRKDGGIAAGIAAAGAANGGGQGNADLTRYAGKSEHKIANAEQNGSKTLQSNRLGAYSAKVSKSELFANCIHCGVPEFTTGSNGQPTFKPCACFSVVNKDENDKPCEFVTLQKNQDGTFGLKFDPKADQDTVKAFLLTLKAKLLLQKKFGM